jgi:presenilin 1
MTTRSRKGKLASTTASVLSGLATRTNGGSGDSTSSHDALLPKVSEVITTKSTTTTTTTTTPSKNNNNTYNATTIIDNNNNTGMENDGLIMESDGLMRDVPLSTATGTAATSSSPWNFNSNNNNDDLSDDDDDDEYFDDDDDDDVAPEMSIEELLYSSSSYYAIARPVTITMIVAALLVVYVNTDSTVQQGQEAMADAYQVWDLSSAKSSVQSLLFSLANAFVMVSAICCMTFIIVILYKYKCMKLLIGYMMTTSATLLGILGGNILSTFFIIYNIEIDNITFYLFMYNFAVVGVLAVFWGQGIPKYITQSYLVATSVILAWHLSYFDDWTTWSLLFMLAMYDLCAVLSPCGPLKALVNLMSQDDAPEMPGLLFEADLPSDAKRPGSRQTPRNNSDSHHQQQTATGLPPTSPANAIDGSVGISNSNTGTVPVPVPAVGSAAFVQTEDPGKEMKVPFAIAKVYQLTVIQIPHSSKKFFNNSTDPSSEVSTTVSESPLLLSDNRMYQESAAAGVVLPVNPTIEQLRALVVVKLPSSGGQLEQVSKRGKKVYLERDRNGNPKRIVWCDRSGKVFAEIRDDDDEANTETKERNTIRLGLGDFIFYSVLVAKAAQYSFTTFAVCTLVILAGLGGTLVLLSVYHHALPALPISIFLGVIFYLLTRLAMIPWIEMVLTTPVYV